MRIFVIGKGYVGRRVIDSLSCADQVIVGDRRSNLESVIRDYRPELVFNCAGYSGVPNVDACEDNKEQTLRDNFLLPLKLIRAAAGAGIPVAHMSSGCLYMGHQLYKEADPPNFTGSFYSLSKVLAEETVREYPEHYIFRIRMPFSGKYEAKNLLVKLLTYPKLVDYYNSITQIDQAVAAMSHLVLTGAPFGTYNIVNSPPVWTHEIAQILGIKANWVHRSFFNTMVKAPRSECTLEALKLSKEFRMQDTYEALRQAALEVVPVFNEQKELQ